MVLNEYGLDLGKDDLPFPRGSELSPLELELCKRLNRLLIAGATERMVKEGSNRRDNKAEPVIILYEKGLVQLTLHLCQKYDPREVEAAMKKYVPDLF